MYINAIKDAKATFEIVHDKCLVHIPSDIMQYSNYISDMYMEDIACSESILRNLSAFDRWTVFKNAFEKLHPLLKKDEAFLKKIVVDPFHSLMQEEVEGMYDVYLMHLRNMWQLYDTEPKKNYECNAAVVAKIVEEFVPKIEHALDPHGKYGDTLIVSALASFPLTYLHDGYTTDRLQGLQTILGANQVRLVTELDSTMYDFAVIGVPSLEKMPDMSYLEKMKPHSQILLHFTSGCPFITEYLDQLYAKWYRPQYTFHIHGSFETYYLLERS